MTENHNILILGGGPAGMACAMELHNARKKSTIIEKDNKIGGLSKTLKFTEGDCVFRTDIGPHRFFSKNKYLYDFIDDLLKEKWIVVDRKTRQFIDGKYYDYPIDAFQAFRNIGIFRAIGMGVSYFSAVIKYRVFKKEIKNFESYVVAKFGRKLAEFNMLNYSEKIWGISCNEIHSNWAEQRIKGLDLRSALSEAIFKKKSKDGPKTLVDQFHYPQHGTGQIYETIAEKIESSDGEIKTNSYPTRIIYNNRKITAVQMEVNGEKMVVNPSFVVSSIPINEFVKILSPKPPIEVVSAVANLKWRAQVYLFITLNKEKVTDDNWVYFPNKEIPFGRISEMKNFSKDMSPEGKTSLFVEFFVSENDTIWKMDKQEIFDLALKNFESLHLFAKNEVRNFYVLKKKYVYPIYDLHYQKHIKIVKSYLNGIDNLFYIGRLGRFQYTNQDHSLEMGILTARSIVENKRYNLEDIGSEKEYFENGFMKKQDALKN